MFMKIESHRLANRFVPFIAIVLIMAFAAPVFAQSEVQIVVKHLKTSQDFTLKVADQMPEADYAFKLTPPQMSFAEQMVHLAQAMDAFTAPFSEQKATAEKPASMNKKDVIAFVRRSFDNVIVRVSKLAPAQLSKTYTTEEGSMTGLELLMATLDHTTHHRASAEMYLRAKGITPVEYEF